MSEAEILVETAASKIASLVKASERRFETAFESVREGIIYQNQEGRILVCNSASAELFGLSVSKLEGQIPTNTIWKLISENGAPIAPEKFPANLALATGKTHSDIVVSSLKPDGSKTWIKFNSVPIFNDSSPVPNAVVTSLTDVTAFKETEARLRSELKILQESQSQIEARRRGLEKANQELRQSADTDPATKLKNRRSFLERLCSEVALASRNQFALSIIFIEVDQLAAIMKKGEENSTNDLLIMIGEVMRQSCRISDFVARYSEDKFVMLLPHTSLSQASQLAARLIQSIQDIKSEYSLNASIGAAEYKNGSLTNELMNQVEDALFRAKAVGVGTCHSES